MARPMLSFVGIVGLFALPLVFVTLIGFTRTTITPNNSFFTLSIDGIPLINETSWTLVVDGHVGHPLTFTYVNLSAQPSTTVVAKLHCVEGPSGTAAWTGIPLNDILAMAGVQAGAMDVVFYGADGYTSSLSWPTENASSVLLAFEMNAMTLPPDQGFPVRVVAPDQQGYKWVKWVYRIEVVDYDYKGYWESRGWSDNARLATSSDWLGHATLLSFSFMVGGLAAVSGVKQSSATSAFQGLPAFVSRRFHVSASVLFLVSVAATFAYWVGVTLVARGAVFYTLHGIMGLLSVGLLVIGMLGVSSSFRRSHGMPSWHGSISLYAFGFYAFTILLGFALAF